jgi:hypothetical protein
MKIHALTRPDLINIAFSAIAFALFANSSASAADTAIGGLKCAPGA